MNEDLQTNEEKPTVKRSRGRTKSYDDAGAPQFEEAATITSASPTEAGSKQLDVEAAPVEDLVDGGPAPSAPTET